MTVIHTPVPVVILSWSLVWVWVSVSQSISNINRENKLDSSTPGRRHSYPESSPADPDPDLDRDCLPSTSLESISCLRSDVHSRKDFHSYSQIKNPLVSGLCFLSFSFSLSVLLYSYYTTVRGNFVLTSPWPRHLIVNNEISFGIPEILVGCDLDCATCRLVFRRWYLHFIYIVNPRRGKME